MNKSRLVLVYIEGEFRDQQLPEQTTQVNCNQNDQVQVKKQCGGNKSEATSQEQNKKTKGNGPLINEY